MTGLAIPKPAKRGPKPKRPIARKARPARVRRTPRGKALHAADLKWAKAIRESGPCAALGVFVAWKDGRRDLCMYTHALCSGPVDAAHIVSRRYAATRTDTRNGMPLCRRAHGFFTEHPLAWAAFLATKIGAKRHEALRRKANGGGQ